MLHNVAEGQKKPSFTPEEDSFTHGVLEQPNLCCMDRIIYSNTPEGKQNKERGQAIRNPFRGITDQLPLREQVVLTRR